MRALVVDDSTLFRKVVRDALGEIPGVEVVGVATDGKRALEKIEDHRPDLVTLDLEMPELDGIGVLTALASRPSKPAVVMVSGHTTQGAQATTRALGLGAYDFILKPSGGSIEENREALRQSLSPIVKSLSKHEAPTAKQDVRPAPITPTVRPNAAVPPKAIVIGVSTGGPAALGKLLPRLPSNLPPILIVQHMPPDFTRSLAEQLDKDCQLTVAEAADGVVPQSGDAYIAPGGLQMGVEQANGQMRLYVNEDPPERSCRPSVNYLFRSAASAYSGRCLAAVLTGMGDDGLEGCVDLSQKGAAIVAQNQETSVVYGMPRNIVEAGLADAVLPLEEIADYIKQSCLLREPVCL